MRLNAIDRDSRIAGNARERGGIILSNTRLGRVDEMLFAVQLPEHLNVADHLDDVGGAKRDGDAYIPLFIFVSCHGTNASLGGIEQWLESRPAAKRELLSRGRGCEDTVQ